MNTSSSTSKPARLSFLAIFNPTLGPTDETFPQQLVFYYSRAAIDVRIAAKQNARNDAAGGDALRAEENEKLRQIGLAQGMVDFAKSFSNDEPVDSIETEKSRIVLHELEKGWWILASIDLTRLPSIPQSSSAEPSKKTEAKVEYSSREVSPPALLIQQLLQAHYIFCLHHGPSLNDLFVRMTRDKFCNTLDRFWTRFARTWHVLLHGNPAADVFSGVKLGSGGELGFGVGEEEWGSGEREVLEDLCRRTEGLLDMVVMRFGEPATSADKDSFSQDDELPWLGGGQQPLASDGIIFGGLGAIQRRSLRDISLWMRQIYTYGEHAYGVKDNVLRERRKRKRRQPSDPPKPANGSVRNERQAKTTRNRKQEHPTELTRETSEASTLKPLGRQPSSVSGHEISHDRTNTPGDQSTPLAEDAGPNIPPPIVSSAEQALKKVTTQPHSNDEQGESPGAEATDEASTTLGIPDQYMKYLTFGLSTLGKQRKPPTSRRVSTQSVKTVPPTKAGVDSRPARPTQPSYPSEIEEAPQAMSHVDPMPEGEALKSKLAKQKRQENRGHFVIGLKGDLLELDELSEDDEQTGLSEAGFGDETDGSRIVLRTVQLEVVPDVVDAQDTNEPLSRKHSETGNDDKPGSSWRRLRVLIYVHRPFMYCFLFRDRTGSLQYTGFYKTLHRNLVPIHKPLLSSTNVEKVRQRIEGAHISTSSEQISSGQTSPRSRHRPTSPNRLPAKALNSSPIYDLIYDPQRLTLHISIPNIPEPGTPAAEGLLPAFSKSNVDNSTSWTRIEALNVHSQILNTLASVKKRPAELERTSKTNRGWWVVWMKVPPAGAFSSNNDAESDAQAGGEGKSKAGSSLRPIHSSPKEHDGQAEQEDYGDAHRIAFLVRKASDAPTAVAKTSSTGSRAMTSMLEVMSLGMAGRDDDSSATANDGWGPAALAGGIGIDARKYVEGLLSLNR